VEKAGISSTGLAVTGVLTSSSDATVGGNLAVTGNLGTWTSVSFTGTWANEGSDSAGRYRKLGDVVFVEGFVAFNQLKQEAEDAARAAAEDATDWS